MGPSWNSKWLKPVSEDDGCDGNSIFQISLRPCPSELARGCYSRDMDAPATNTSHDSRDQEVETLEIKRLRLLASLTLIGGFGLVLAWRYAGILRTARRALLAPRLLE